MSFPRRRVGAAVTYGRRLAKRPRIEEEEEEDKELSPSPPARRYGTGALSPTLRIDQGSGADVDGHVHKLQSQASKRGQAPKMVAASPQRRKAPDGKSVASDKGNGHQRTAVASDMLRGTAFESAIAAVPVAVKQTQSGHPQKRPQPSKQQTPTVITAQQRPTPLKTPPEHQQRHATTSSPFGNSSLTSAPTTPSRKGKASSVAAAPISIHTPSTSTATGMPARKITPRKRPSTPSSARPSSARGSTSMTSTPISPTPNRSAKDLSALFEGVGRLTPGPSAGTSAAVVNDANRAGRLMGRMAPRRVATNTATEDVDMPDSPSARLLTSGSPSPAGASLRYGSPARWRDVSSTRIDGFNSQPAELEYGGTSRRLRTPSPTPPHSASQPESPFYESPRNAAAGPSRPRTLGINAPTLPGARRTYGAQRSFLAEVEVGDDGVSAPSLRGVHAGAVTSVEAHLDDGSEWGAAVTAVPRSAESDSLHAAAPTSMGILRRSAGQTVTTSMNRKSYLELRKVYGGDSDLGISFGGDFDPSMNASQGSASGTQQQLQSVHSISALRTAGEVRRFNDDLEYLLSGLADDQSTSMRKSSAIEVLRKVCGVDQLDRLASGSEEDERRPEAANTEFLSQLRSVGALERVLDLFLYAATGAPPPPEGSQRVRASASERVVGVASDPVCAVALAIFVARLAQMQVISETVVQQNGQVVFAILDALLLSTLGGADGERGVDPLGDQDSLKKGSNVVKSDVKKLASLREIVDMCALLPPGSSPPSLRSIVLNALSDLTTFRPRGGFDPIAQLVRVPDEEANGLEAASPGKHPAHGAAPTIQLVARALAAEMSKAERRMTAYSRGLDLLPARSRSADDSGPDFGTMDTCARLLELVTGTRDGEEGTLRGAFGLVSTPSDLVMGVQICHLLTRLNDAGDGRLLVGQGALDDVEDVEVGSRRAGSSVEKRADAAAGALLNLLKTLINLTQSDATWCTDVWMQLGGLTTVMRLIIVPFEELVRASRTTYGSRQSSDDEGVSVRDEDEKVVEQLTPSKPRVIAAGGTGLPSSPTSGNEEDDARLSRLAQRFDTLCLSLSLLINLLEGQGSQVRPLLASLVLDPLCVRRACARVCTCTDTPAKRRRADVENQGRAPALRHLARAFAWHHGRSNGKGKGREDEVEGGEDENAVFLTGCLALVLALSIVEEEEGGGGEKEMLHRARLVAAGLSEGGRGGSAKWALSRLGTATDGEAEDVRRMLRPVSDTLDRLAQGEKQMGGGGGQEDDEQEEEEGLVMRMARQLGGFVVGGGESR